MTTMFDSVRCPDCDGGLVESSSERGDYFCPDCTRPVSSRDAAVYCSECTDEPVTRVGHLCADCREEKKAERDEEGENEFVWGEEDDDDMMPIAARDCPCCGAMLIPVNFGIQPLHDGSENYYVGHTCPHCGEIIRRTQGDEEMADHAKESAELDPDPPSDVSSLPVVNL